VVPSFLILVSTLKLNNLLDMYRYQLNPSLDLLLRKVFPTLFPCYSTFSPTFGCTLFCGCSLHPRPARLNCIKIRRVATPKKLANAVWIVDPLLSMVVVRRSPIFLDNCIWTSFLTLFGKRNKFWNQNLCLVSIPINSISLPTS